MAKLKEEGAHFLYTLLHLQLPPVLGRLRLPVVTTPSKTSTEELHKSDLQRFLEAYCIAKPDGRLRFGEFYDAFQKTLDASEKHSWSKVQVSRRLPNQHRVIRGASGDRYVQDLAWKPAITTDQ